MLFFYLVLKGSSAIETKIIGMRIVFVPITGRSDILKFLQFADEREKLNKSDPIFLSIPKLKKKKDHLTMNIQMFSSTSVLAEARKDPHDPHDLEVTVCCLGLDRHAGFRE